MKKLGTFAIFLLTAMLVLAACSNPPEENESSESEETGGTSTFVIDMATDASSLDPHGANDGNSLYVMSTMYDTLVEFDENFDISPSLAESLEQTSDTVWTATLREDVTFHDGSPFNAEVVKANLDRVRDPEIGSPLAFLYTMISDVRVVDEYTVEIETEFPFASLPAHLAHPGGHMISKESIDADYAAIEDGGAPFATINEAPVGTGYFKYDSREPGSSITVVKNEDYWNEEKAKSDAITFRIVPEDGTRVANLETGEADLIYPVNPNDVERLNNTEGTKVQQSASSNLTYLGFNTEVEPFTDPKVRQAISMAINKETIIEGATDGIALPAKGPLAPTVYGYDDSIDFIEYDVEAAKELLAEAGYPDGFSTTLLSNDLRLMIDMGELIQAQLSEIGIDVQIETVEGGTYQEYVAEGNSEMFLGSWGTVTLDADYGLYPMFHSSNHGGAGNRSFIANDELDDLLQRAREEGDPETRLALYKEAQNVLAEEAPLVYLFHSELLAGLNEDVTGFWQYPSSIFYLRDAVRE